MSVDRDREGELRKERDGSDEVAVPRAGVRALRNALENGQADPAIVARLILAHPADRDEMLILLHQTVGNAHVQRVMDALAHAHGQDPAAEPIGATTEQRNASPVATALTGFSGASRDVPYRPDMEAAFGESFADVRSHHGPDAKRATTALNAHAYAVQNDLAFAEDLPPRSVVAHELTHVVQSRGGDATLQAKTAASSPSDAHEREADRVAETVASGGSVAGTISQGRRAAISRMDAWDVIGIATGPGTAAVGRDAAQRSGYQQLIDDITASITQSPAHAKKLLTEVMKDHWYEFLQTTATLMAVELGVAALTAMPDPTMGTKIAAIVLQALLITFVVYAAIEEGPEAIRLGSQWWETVRSAHGDPRKIAAAAELFAETVFHLVLAVMAIIGTVGTVKAGFAFAERAPVREGAMSHPSDTRIGHTDPASAPSRGKASAPTPDAPGHAAAGQTPTVSEAAVRDTAGHDGLSGKPLGDHLLASGASDGLDASPETIRQGTVRMEEHPEFQRDLAALKDKGFELRYGDKDPHVELREVLTPEGELIRTEKVVVVRKGMRYLDFEHELGHVDQIQRLKQPLATERVLENGRPYKGPDRPGLMTKSLDSITEYHNRLVEYFRLKDRNVDASILREHADGVRAARSEYWKKGMKQGRAQSAKTFVQENFPELSELEKRFVTEEGGS